MNKNIFSFKGRIRRRDFALTYLAIPVVQLVYAVYGDWPIDDLSVADAGLVILLQYVLSAQAAKRCHDLGHSGWYQLIPLYLLWMLFGDGEAGANKYGPNPKEELLMQEDRTADPGELV